MAVARTGSVYTSNDGGTGTNQITNITIPTDADMAIVIGMAYTWEGTIDFDILCWDAGGTLDFTQIVESSSPNQENTAFAYRMDSDDSDWPGSGSGRTLDFSYDNTPSYGEATVLFFLSDVDLTSPVMGTDSVNSPASSPWTNSSVGTVGTDDLCIIAGTSYHSTQGVESTPTGSGQTEIYESSDSSNRFAVAEKLNDDTLQIGNISSLQYFGGVAFAIAAAAAAGLSIRVLP